MSYFEIRGGRPLVGSVTVSGAKNAGLAIIPAALLTCDRSIIENLPRLRDVDMFASICKSLGADIYRDESGAMVIDPSRIESCCAVSPEVEKFRASYYLMGALLGRFGHVTVSLPGGCAIGERPIDQHVKGFRALGADVVIDQERGIVTASADELIGAEIYLDIASVGATINIMLAAARATGKTTIHNAAKEPYIIDVANFINMMGGSVKGAGTDEIRIQGRKKLSGCTYAIIPDLMEAGTFMIAAAATGGNVMIRNIIPAHLDAISAKLMECGAIVKTHYGDTDMSVTVKAEKRLRGVNVKTQYYPGFPTDLQQPLTALLATAQGSSTIIDTIYPKRFGYISELIKMGATITEETGRAKVVGVERLTGCDLYACDLRAGAALIVAALCAEGVTRIHNLEYIDRGYESIEKKLLEIGADIKRIE